MKYQIKRELLIVALFIIVLNLSCQSKISSQNKELIPPQVALEKFYNFQGSEEASMDPLILSGEKVVPLVLEEIKNKNMPKRRYAIGFLGNGEYKQALLTLEDILNNPEERDIFRGDALLSIYQINKETGLKHAKVHEKDQNFIGEVAKDILTGASYINEKRTFTDALKSYPEL